MSINGDCAATLVSQFEMSHEDANKVVAAIIDTINDPNFAYRFDRNREDHFMSYDGMDQNDLMLIYWDVVKMLKRTQT